MQAVCETHAFRRAALQAGMSEQEIAALVGYLAENPDAGDLIAGTGGCRKLRWAGRGKGKSGGYRTITFYSGAMMPVYLLTVFGKGEKANLSDAECNYPALADKDAGGGASRYCRRIGRKKRQDAMSKKAFDKIAAGLTEALAIARGETKPARLHIPSDIDVRAIRARTGMSQDDFATAFGFTINQIKDWEQGRARPLGGVRAYLLIIERDARSVLELLRKARTRRAA